ncbi:hypothetical protein G5I_02707 [Acromyrmex echinatior]|uniref:G-protein coupled receptors family 1 profile domain-containing protein n=1 Tax=Acromyrmex echinatior TaxID=103372 RepID=F4WAY6_ACREC|nr:hypothetical protein G5I_02707 [Acromyrmex echinatior]
MVLDNLTVMSAIDELVDDVQSNSTNVTDFPDYDINDSFNHFEWAELAPVLVVYTLTFFLGLIGNVIIIASTLCRLRPLPATPTNVFLGGLATADLLLIIFCIPVKVPPDDLTNISQLCTHSLNCSTFMDNYALSVIIFLILLKNWNGKNILIVHILAYDKDKEIRWGLAK